MKTPTVVPNFWALTGSEQRKAISQAQTTLEVIRKATDGTSTGRIDRFIKSTAPELPIILSVLKTRDMLNLSPPPNRNPGHTPPEGPTREVIAAADCILGTTNRSVKAARDAAMSHAAIKKIENGARVLINGTQGITEPSERASIQKNFGLLYNRSRCEREKIGKLEIATGKALKKKPGNVCGAAIRAQKMRSGICHQDRLKLR